MLWHLRREQRVLMVTDGLLSLLLPTVSLTKEGLSYKWFVCKGHCPLTDVQTQDTDQQGACKVWGEVSWAPKNSPYTNPKPNGARGGCSGHSRWSSHSLVWLHLYVRIVVSWAQVAVKLSYRAGYTGQTSPESSCPQLYFLPCADAWVWQVGSKVSWMLAH